MLQARGTQRGSKASSFDGWCRFPIPSLQAICEHLQEKGQQNYDKTMHSTQINKGDMTKDIGTNIHS